MALLIAARHVKYVPFDCTPLVSISRRAAVCGFFRLPATSFSFFFFHLFFALMLRYNVSYRPVHYHLNVLLSAFSMQNLCPRPFSLLHHRLRLFFFFLAFGVFD